MFIVSEHEERVIHFNVILYYWILKVEPNAQNCKIQALLRSKKMLLRCS